MAMIMPIKRNQRLNSEMAFGRKNMGRWYLDGINLNCQKPFFSIESRHEVFYIKDTRFHYPKLEQNFDAEYKHKGEALLSGFV